MKNFIVTVIHMLSGFVCTWLMLTMIVWHGDFPPKDCIVFSVIAFGFLILDYVLCLLIARRMGSIYPSEKWRHFAGTALIPIFLFVVLRPSWYNDGRYTFFIMQNIVVVSAMTVVERSIICWRL